MKTHVQMSRKTHFAIQVAKNVCPVCKSGFNHQCILTKSPFTLMVPNMVHIERVNNLNSGTGLTT